jgi:hypothetical protein
LVDGTSFGREAGVGEHGIERDIEGGHRHRFGQVGDETSGLGARNVGMAFSEG